MTSYSLIEHTLRLYSYLGHKHSIYISAPLISPHDEMHHTNGILIIGKIVKNNIPEEVNSIVPIILKIKEEDKLINDKHLIFALAVCAAFNLKECEQLVSDAYAAIQTVCSDGLKFLMFFNFYKTARSLLCKKGFLSKECCTGLPKKFRITLTNWYLNRDPCLVMKQIVRHKYYAGLTHAMLMKLTHIHSNEPSYNMIILYVIYGMDKIEEEFGTKLTDVQPKDDYETYEDKPLKFIYNYLKAVHDLKKMDEISLRNAIESNCWGKDFQVVPKNMLTSPKVLIALMKNMPMRNVLEHTFVFAKNKVFLNTSPDNGIREYILSFKDRIKLEQSRIHPVESFLEYVKYSRTILNHLKFQNIDANEPKKKNIYLSQNCRLKEIFETKNLFQRDDPNSEVEKMSNKSGENKNTAQSVVNNANEDKASTSAPRNNINLSLEINKLTSTASVTKKNDMLEQKSEDQVCQKQSKTRITISTPLPRFEKKILEFLSVDLITKTVQYLKPTNHRIIITYDRRLYLKTTQCACTPLLNVNEAITLIIFSLFEPQIETNKPHIRSLNGPSVQGNKEVPITLWIAQYVGMLEKQLFGTPANILNKENIPNVNPLSTMNWAMANKQMHYDIFVFLGSNKMNLHNLKQSKKRYEEFSKKPVKIIVCCLNKKHVYQSSLSCRDILFIVGFDKNVCKIIDAFINNEF